MAAPPHAALPLNKPWRHIMHKQYYGHLMIMTGLSFIAMFILMYAMVDRLANVYPNVNQAPWRG
jgi:hypothetical protein